MTATMTDALIWNAAIKAAAEEVVQAAFRAPKRGPRESVILHDAMADAERAILALVKSVPDQRPEITTTQEK